MKIILLIAAILLPVSHSLITGPNGLPCSGNGNMEGTVCDCFQGFSGAACEKRLCPEGEAWADVPTADDTAHGLAECSNKGHCDYDTGTCLCVPGFEGKACERMSCSMNCNGHGSCFSMERQAALPEYGMDYSQVWDAKRVYGCVCDEVLSILIHAHIHTSHSSKQTRNTHTHTHIHTQGFQSFDCQDTLICPTGDDPLTTGQENEIQYFRCDVENTESKKTSFHICWRGECTTSISWDESVASVQAKINALSSVTDSDKTDNLPGVVLTFETQGVTSVCAGYTLTVNPWTVYPPQIVKVEFKKDFGDLEPLEFVFPRGMTAAQTPTIELACKTDSVYKGHLCSKQLLVNHEGAQFFAVKGTKEEIECSGRGICEAAGKCACDANFASSNGEGGAGNRGDCGYQLPTASVFDCIGDLPCSMRGICSGDADYVCTCSSAFGGADCSLINCPKGRAWFDAPISANMAHTSQVPCSARGFCDTSTGVCTCQEGFTGAACDVLDCPTSPDTVGLGLDCSGHGSCLTNIGACIVRTSFMPFYTHTCAFSFFLPFYTHTHTHANPGTQTRTESPRK